MGCGRRGCQCIERRECVYPVLRAVSLESSTALFSLLRGSGPRLICWPPVTAMGDSGTKRRWVSKVGQDPSVRKWPNPEIIRKKEEFRAGR